MARKKKRVFDARFRAVGSKRRRFLNRTGDSHSDRRRLLFVESYQVLEGCHRATIPKALSLRISLDANGDDGSNGGTMLVGCKWHPVDLR
jgi:hypothetical protein